MKRYYDPGKNPMPRNLAKQAGTQHFTQHRQKA